MFDANLLWGGEDRVATKAPAILSPSSRRAQTSLLSRPERKLLDRLCAHMPRAVTPDWLTGVGFAGAVLVFAGYATSRIEPAFLWLATFGIILNWFGDSLDGSLARYRRIEKSSYGYFIDHSVDTISILLILLGLGLTSYIRLETALLALVGYLMMCIYVFLLNHVTGKFQLSFIAIGPTELRISLIVTNVFMYSFGGISVLIGREIFSYYDIALSISATFLVCLYVMNIVKTTRQLRREDALALRQQPALTADGFEERLERGSPGDPHSCGFECPRSVCAHLPAAAIPLAREGATRPKRRLGHRY